MTNTIFQLISRGLPVPQGFGFPVFPLDTSEIPEETRLLRELLLPLQDTEGLGQLFRWHHGILVATRSVYRGISDEQECYDAGDFYLPPIHSPVPVAPDPRGGFYKLGWVWAGETPTLAGKFILTGPSAYSLTFGKVTFTGGVHQFETSETRMVDWPEFMQCSASLFVDSTNWVTGFQADLKFRPVGFSEEFILGKVRTEHSRILADAGLLAAFDSAVNGIDKISIIWLAVAILEA